MKREKTKLNLEALTTARGEKRDTKEKNLKLNDRKKNGMKRKAISCNKKTCDEKREVKREKQAKRGGYSTEAEKKRNKNLNLKKKNRESGHVDAERKAKVLKSSKGETDREEPEKIMEKVNGTK
ncbi:hypothetical protein RUM43_012710 [Polyplax serrata]|uniref:Uncharacterized protein n=1 Tax=Polyplax serrata TaxID=468196 RepID=A0AAN8S416_POLSC